MSSIERIKCPLVALPFWCALPHKPQKNSEQSLQKNVAASSSQFSQMDVTFLLHACSCVRTISTKRMAEKCDGNSSTEDSRKFPRQIGH